MYWETYDTLLAETQALCGCDFSENELPRIHALFNRRFRKAYDASDYWPRYLVIAAQRNVFLIDGRLPAISRVDERGAYEQEGNFEGIEKALKIYSAHPLLSRNFCEFDFVTLDGEIQLITSARPTSVHVTYKSPYHAHSFKIVPGGNFIPDEFYPYIVQGTYADQLRAEGQTEKAEIAEKEATEILQDRMIELCNNKLTDMLSAQFQGHGSRQFR